MSIKVVVSDQKSKISNCSRYARVHVKTAERERECVCVCVCVCVRARARACKHNFRTLYIHMSFINVLAIFGHHQVDFTTTHMEKNV